MYCLFYFLFPRTELYSSSNLVLWVLNFLSLFSNKQDNYVVIIRQMSFIEHHNRSFCIIIDENGKRVMDYSSTFQLGRRTKMLKIQLKHKCSYKLTHIFTNVFMYKKAAKILSLLYERLFIGTLELTLNCGFISVTAIFLVLRRWPKTRTEGHLGCESLHLAVSQTTDDGGTRCQRGWVAKHPQLLVHC